MDKIRTESFPDKNSLLILTAIKNYNYYFHLWDFHTSLNW